MESPAFSENVPMVTSSSVGMNKGDFAHPGFSMTVAGGAFFVGLVMALAFALCQVARGRSTS